MSLGDPVKTDDYINAFVYTDLTSWSDTYCYFDTYTKSATEGEELTLTLSAAGYDASYNPIVLPVEGATITVDGTATEYKTDAEGKVTVSLDAGAHLISATSGTQTLVPPVCLVSVEAKTPVTDATTTEAPVAEAPATEAPATEPPVTEAPVTEAPVTETPTVEAPVTTAPEAYAGEAVTSPTTADASIMMLAVLGTALLACLAVISAKRGSDEK